MTQSHSKSSDVKIQNYKYYHKISLVFILCLIIANIGATKLFTIGNLIMPGGIVVFPLLYVINDILTEVYGFKASRKVIWLALFCNLFSTFVLFGITLLPPAPHWSNHEGFASVFSLAPRILVASFTSYFIGELLNASTISILKIQLEGKFFALRAILSTCVGAFIETTIFALIAFSHYLPFSEVLNITLTLTIVKVLYELTVLPITVKIATYLKKAENIDVYEKPTLRNAFSFY
jgi:uncharacterized integral membrane protein (TIGR00697 family)